MLPRCPQPLAPHGHGSYSTSSSLALIKATPWPAAPARRHRTAIRAVRRERWRGRSWSLESQLARHKCSSLMDGHGERQRPAGAAALARAAGKSDPRSHHRTCRWQRWTGRPWRSSSYPTTAATWWCSTPGSLRRSAGTRTSRTRPARALPRAALHWQSSEALRRGSPGWPHATCLPRAESADTALEAYAGPPSRPPCWRCPAAGCFRRVSLVSTGSAPRTPLPGQRHRPGPGLVRGGAGCPIPSSAHYTPTTKHQPRHSLR